ncbi:hypothetical protein HDU67_005302 [Dinochytrium kinnereticum]|nr:hypothetical protein HDU67_005302 [Dinochytrium kinnereticum]
METNDLNPIPNLRGPVDHLTVDANSKSLYIVGTASQSLLPYVGFWDGKIFTEIPVDVRTSIALAKDSMESVKELEGPYGPDLRDSGDSVYGTLVDTYKRMNNSLGAKLLDPQEDVIEIENQMRRETPSVGNISRASTVIGGDVDGDFKAGVDGNLKNAYEMKDVARGTCEERLSMTPSNIEPTDLPDIAPVWGTAIYTFSTDEPGELQFEQGERILVIDYADPVWW